GQGKGGAASKSPMKNVEELESSLSEPSDKLVDTVSRLRGDLLILGAGGKMGPTFARMARRALDLAASSSRVIAVSRFTNHDLSGQENPHAVTTTPGDLFHPNFCRALPAAKNILSLGGMKSGPAPAPPRPWAPNPYVPALAPNPSRPSRIVALSTGNVYGL